MVWSIAAGWRGSRVCEALTMVWSAMLASFELSTETRPSLGRGSTKSEAIGSIVRHPAMTPTA